jgi:hypothetical protein
MISDPDTGVKDNRHQGKITANCKTNNAKLAIF